jgi:hypothetical protein
MHKPASARDEHCRFNGPPQSFCLTSYFNSSSEQTATLPHLPDAINAYASLARSSGNLWVMMSAG